MIDVVPGLLFDSLPWWLAALLLQVAVLVFGMALDETYVNRTTVLTGAIAAQIHVLPGDGAGPLVALYADVGLALGAYGLYAYVVDGYVANWFRVPAYFAYSPLSVLLVVLTPGWALFGFEVFFLPALALAGYANLQLMAELRPTEPYYFGPGSPEAFEAVVETEAEPGPSTEASSAPAETPNDGVGTDEGAAAGRSSPEPTATAASSERGILPEFMRRL